MYMFIESIHRDRIYLFALLVCYGQIKHEWSFTRWTALFKYVLQSWPIKINVNFFLQFKSLLFITSATIPTSDLGDVVSPVGLSTDMKMNILSIKHQADALRSDLHSLRRLQQINKESILETVDDAWKKIKVRN